MMPKLTCKKLLLGKLNLGEPSRSFLNREIARNNFELLPISGATLVTRDERLRQYPHVKTLW
jgi:PIN domain nuclease of toxin-antitoxin system